MNSDLTGQVRVAAVGLGWVTTERHLPVMEADRRFEVVGVIDRHAGLAAAVAEKRRYRRSAETADLSTVDWLDEIDALTVGAAPFAHFDLVSQALDLGKHVLTEKPFTMTLEEGDKLVELARQADRCLAVVHNFQFSRSMKALLRDIERGRLGQLRSATGIQLGNPRRRLPSWYDKLPLGLFYDESPHLFYLLDRLAGGSLSVDNVEVIPSQSGLNTPGQINVTMRAGTSDAAFAIRCNFESPISEWHILVLGEEAAGIVDVFRDIYIRLPNDGEHTGWPVLRTSLSGSWQHWSQHLVSGLGHVTGRLKYGNREVFARFADAVLGERDRLAPIAAEKGRDILALQHAVLRAAGAVNHAD